MATGALLNIFAGTYWDGTVVTRDLIEYATVSLEPWQITPRSRELCTYGAGPQSSYPCWAALGMSINDWRIGATFAQATSWDALTIPLDDKSFRATRGNPDPYGPSPCFFASAGGNTSQGCYCGWSGTLPTLSDPSGPDLGGALLTADDTLFWSQVFTSDYAAYETGGVLLRPTGQPWAWNGTPSAAAIIAAANASTHKVFMEVTVTGGTAELVACKEAGADPVWVRDIAPGEPAFIISAPFGYLGIRRKAGQANVRLVRMKTFVRGQELTGVLFTIQSRYPQATTLSITARAGMNLTRIGPSAASGSYDVATGLGTFPVPTGEDYPINALRLTGFNGARSIPAGGYQLKVEVPDNSLWGTRAVHGRWTKPWLDDLAGLGLDGIRTLDLSTRIFQGAGQHTRMPATALPADGQHWDAGISPEAMMDHAKFLNHKFHWHVFPHGVSGDYAAAWIERAIVARGVSKIALGAEPGNEAWHASARFAAYYVGEREGPDGVVGWYGEFLHDYVDALDARIPNWRHLDVNLICAWQTGVGKDILNRIMLRKRNGVSLLRRAAGNILVANAPYWGGGVGGEQFNLTYQSVLDACIAQNVSLTDRAAIANVMHGLMITSRGAAVAEMNRFSAMIKEWCIENGEAFNAAKPVAYETNQHFQDSVRAISYQGTPSNINDPQWNDLRLGVHAYRFGAQEAELTRLHMLDSAAAGYRWTAFYNGPTNLFDEPSKPEVNWGLSLVQGETPRRPKYLKLAEANAALAAANAAEEAALALKSARRGRKGLRLRPNGPGSPQGSIIYNDRFAFAGDSRTAQAVDTATGRLYWESRGAAAWMLAETGYRVRADVVETATFGIGGDTTSQLRARWPAVLASPASNIALLIATNNPNNGVSLAQGIADITAMLAQAVAAGKRMFLANEMQRHSPAAFTGQALADHIAMHDWLDLQPNGTTIIRWDTWSLADGPEDYVDGVHQNTSLGRKMGQSLAALVNGLYPPLTAPFAAPMQANPEMTGETGAKSAAITGSVATSYTATLSSAASTLTIAASKETIDGTEWQTFAITGGATGSSTATLNFKPVTSPTFVAGVEYEVSAELIVEPGSTKILSVTPTLTVTGGTNPPAARPMDGYSDPDQVPVEGYRITLITPPFEMPATATSAVGDVRLTFVSSAAPRGTVKIGNFRIRESSRGWA